MNALRYIALLLLSVVSRLGLCRAPAVCIAYLILLGEEHLSVAYATIKGARSANRQYPP